MYRLYDKPALNASLGRVLERLDERMERKDGKDGKEGESERRKGEE